MIEIITIVVEILPRLRYYSDTKVVTKENPLMMPIVRNFRFAPIAVVLVAGVSMAFASPASVSPLQHSVVAATSPVIVPPMPTDGGGKLAESSPVIVPPMPTDGGGKVAESSPVIVPPMPTDGGGKVAESSPVIVPPMPTDGGGKVAVSSPVIVPPMPTDGGGKVAA
jgi:hypothetical protein